MNQFPHVLFVCLGNTCRSPCAHAIFLQMLFNADLDQDITSDSCGTAAFNNGKPADWRVIDVMGARGRLLLDHTARQICDEDFEFSTHIMTMDWSTFNSVSAWAPPGYPGEIALLQEYNPEDTSKQIPDPYYRDAQAFQSMVDRLEGGCRGLLHHICLQHGIHLNMNR